jgi:hypothetical protein
MTEEEHYYPSRKGREGYSTTKRLRKSAASKIGFHKDLDKIISEYAIEDIPENQVSVEKYFTKYYRRLYALLTKDKLKEERKKVRGIFIKQFKQPEMFRKDPRLMLDRSGTPSYRLHGDLGHYYLDLGDQLLTAIRVIDDFLTKPQLRKKWHDKILTEEIEREVDEYRAQRRRTKVST